MERFVMIILILSTIAVVLSFNFLGLANLTNRDKKKYLFTTFFSLFFFSLSFIVYTYYFL